MYSIGQSGFWVLVFFLVVLTIGFVYEYASGALNYANKEKDSELPPQPLNLIKGTFQSKNIFKQSIRNFSTASNREEFKDYWINIKPVSEWYNLDKNSYFTTYINKYNNQNGIYNYRFIL
jgi:hypothetical protein